MADGRRTTTVIVNKTKKALDMRVGNQYYFVNLTRVPRGGKHTMQVDYNDTYQEFLIGVDGNEKQVVVTSDDCCDYKCITATEVDGRFDVHKVPRFSTKFKPSRDTSHVAHGTSRPERRLLRWRMCH